MMTEWWPHSLLCTSQLSLLQTSAHAEKAHNAILKVELFRLWPLFSVALGTCNPVRWYHKMCGDFLMLNMSPCPSSSASSLRPTCPFCPLHGDCALTSVFPSSRLLLPPPPPSLSRFSRWFLGAASPPSPVGWAGRRRRVAPTAPRREPFTRSSTCRSQSALWRVRGFTAALKMCTKYQHFCIQKCSLSFLDHIKAYKLRISKNLYLVCFQCVRMAGGAAS